jgi:hypothetical protein
MTLARDAMQATIGTKASCQWGSLGFIVDAVLCLLQSNDNRLGSGGVLRGAPNGTEVGGQNLRGVIHLVELLSSLLLLARDCEDLCVSADLHVSVNTCGLRELRQTQTHLPNQIRKVALRVRSIRRRSLVGLVKCRNRSMEDADGSFAELQVFVGRARIVLYAKTPVSNRAIRYETDAS